MRSPKSAGLDAENRPFYKSRRDFFILQVNRQTLAPWHPRNSTPAFQTTSHVIEAIQEHPWVVASGPGVPAIGRPNWDVGKSAGKKQIDVARIIYIRESILAEFQPL